MIVDEKVTKFIHTLNREEDIFIQRLEKEAHENHVPIIREETRELMKVLMYMKKPKRILEIGTAIGYSSIIMATHMPEDGKIITIERNDDRYEKAIANIKEANLEHKIEVRKGDALDVLKEVKGNFDFIFTDAAKGQYQNFYDLTIEKLVPEGTLVCDNVLQDGEVALSRYAVTRRDHTIHQRMREFLYQMKQDTRLETVVLPVGDGVTISYKR